MTCAAPAAFGRAAERRDETVFAVVVVRFAGVDSVVLPGRQAGIGKVVLELVAVDESSTVAHSFVRVRELVVVALVCDVTRNGRPVGWREARVVREAVWVAGVATLLDSSVVRGAVPCAGPGRGVCADASPATARPAAIVAAPQPSSIFEPVSRYRDTFRSLTIANPGCRASARLPRPALRFKCQVHEGADRE